MLKAATTENRSSGAIGWMAGHSVTANLLMAVLLVGGIIFSLKIKKEVFPDYELDMVSITVPYPGASPEEIERGIILAIEEAILDLEGIKKITSSAEEGIMRAKIFRPSRRTSKTKLTESPRFPKRRKSHRLSSPNANDSWFPWPFTEIKANGCSGSWPKW
jgi:hypothetical protein